MEPLTLQIAYIMLNESQGLLPGPPQSPGPSPQLRPDDGPGREGNRTKKTFKPEDQKNRSRRYLAEYRIYFLLLSSFFESKHVHRSFADHTK